MSATVHGLAARRSRAALAAIGRLARRRAQFLLMLAALTWGVLSEAARPASWRRTVRGEFRRTLRQAVGGGLATTMVTAVLAGLAMVAEALHWLGLAGQQQLAGPILVTVLVREITPLLIGLILLGRSGTVVVQEVGELQLGGQARALAGLGIDPFLLLVLPRATALAVATLALVALAAGSVTAVVSVVLLAEAVGLPREVVLSMAPKSVTAGVAMGISESLHADPSLTAVAVILTGIMGAITVTPLMNRMRITDFRARGFAVGIKLRKFFVHAIEEARDADSVQLRQPDLIRFSWQSSAAATLDLYRQLQRLA